MLEKNLFCDRSFSEKMSFEKNDKEVFFLRFRLASNQKSKRYALMISIDQKLSKSACCSIIGARWRQLPSSIERMHMHGTIQNSSETITFVDGNMLKFERLAQIIMLSLVRTMSDIQ